MQKLVDGVAIFQQTVFPGQKKLMTRLAKKQTPMALFITCADSRICPNLLTQTDPGELFILRVAGNIVPAYGTVHGGEAATIEYAISALNVKHVVVCGHSLCGAMDAVLHPEPLENMPAVKSYLCHAEATRRIMQENFADLPDNADRLLVTVQQNVLVQAENLKTHPAVASALARGELQLHRWVYQMEHGRVLAYSPEQTQFLPLESVNLAEIEPVTLRLNQKEASYDAANGTARDAKLPPAHRNGNGQSAGRRGRNGVAVK